LFIISVFEKRLKGGSPLCSPFQNTQQHHNHEIKAVVSSRTAINTTLQNGRSSFLTGKAITTRAHIATAAHWFGHKPSTAINDRDLAGPTLQLLHQFSQPNHILPLSLSLIVDCASTNGAATTLEAITALLQNCVTLNPPRWPLLSTKQQLDSSYTHHSLPHCPPLSYIYRNGSRNGRKVSIDGDAPFCMTFNASNS
jgi:hypothetical protein